MYSYLINFLLILKEICTVGYFKIITLNFLPYLNYLLYRSNTQPFWKSIFECFQNPSVVLILMYQIIVFNTPIFKSVLLHSVFIISVYIYLIQLKRFENGKSNRRMNFFLWMNFFLCFQANIKHILDISIIFNTNINSD